MAVKIKTVDRTRRFYWISIEGTGCSLLPLPMTRAEMLGSWLNIVKADQCLGFPSKAEQERMQRICLTSAIEAVEEEMYKLKPRVVSGEVAVWQPGMAD